MTLGNEYRATAARLRVMAEEPVHHTTRERLREIARQFEQLADIRGAMEQRPPERV
jgi:hypothetical protein